MYANLTSLRLLSMRGPLHARIAPVPGRTQDEKKGRGRARSEHDEKNRRIKREECEGKEKIRTE